MTLDACILSADSAAGSWVEEQATAIVVGSIIESVSGTYAIQSFSSRLTVIGSVLLGGTGADGESFALAETDSYLAVINSVLDGGRGPLRSTAAIIGGSKRALFINDVILGGNASEESSGVSASATVTLANSIIDAGTGDSANAVFLYSNWDGHEGATLLNNDFWGATTDCVLWSSIAYYECTADITTLNACDRLGCERASGNISADPLFVAPGDYHVQSDSPCVNAGTAPHPAINANLPTQDIDGQSRPQGGGWDIGIDEQ